MIRKPLALALPILLLAGTHATALAAPSDVRVERAAPDRVTVTWADQSPVDVYLATRPDAQLSQAKLVSDDNRAGRLELPANPAARPYFLLKDVHIIGASVLLGTGAGIAFFMLLAHLWGFCRLRGGLPAAGRMAPAARRDAAVLA